MEAAWEDMKANPVHEPIFDEVEGWVNTAEVAMKTALRDSERFLEAKEIPAQAVEAQPSPALVQRNAADTSPAAEPPEPVSDGLRIWLDAAKRKVARDAVEAALLSREEFLDPNGFQVPTTDRPRSAEACPQSSSKNGGTAKWNERRLEGQQGRPQFEETCSQCAWCKGNKQHTRDECPATYKPLKARHVTQTKERLKSYHVFGRVWPVDREVRSLPGVEQDVNHQVSERTRRQLLNDCTDADLAAALRTDERVTDVTPLTEAAGYLARLKVFFAEEGNDVGEMIGARREEPPGVEVDVVENDGSWVPPWGSSGCATNPGGNGKEIPRRDTGYLFDVASGTERFFENSRGNVRDQDNFLAGASMSDSLDTARPRIMEQLEQSFRNLAPEFQGSEAHDNRGGGSPEWPFRVVPSQRRCQQNQNGVQRQELAPEQRAGEDGNVAFS